MEHQWRSFGNIIREKPKTDRERSEGGRKQRPIRLTSETEQARADRESGILPALRLHPCVGDISFSFSQEL